ncbi:MAG: hypothetical protein U5N86_04170 [Planctomycetota bacterium]|nr:hypothetical protein [Planctomycetota bacterium]
MRHEFDHVSHEDISVTLRDPASAQSIRETADLPNVLYCEGELALPCELSAGLRTKRTVVIGLSEGQRLHTPIALNGSYVERPESGVVLSHKLAQLLGCTLGSSLELRPLIKERRKVTVHVSGIVETFLGLGAYIDSRYLSRLIGESDVYNRLLISTGDGKMSDPLMEELRDLPTLSGIASRERKLELIYSTFGETMGTILTIMIFFASLIGFASTMNTSLVSLNERKREVGTFR